MRQPGCPPGWAGRPGTLVWWRQGSPTWLSVGDRRASPASSGSAGATWGWCQASRPVPGWVVAGRPACRWARRWPGRGRRRSCRQASRLPAWPRRCLRGCVWTWSSSGRSTGAVGAVGWLVGGHVQPPGSQPPPTVGPPSAPARRTRTHQPRQGGLLMPFGDALVSQRLAQPGMLVVHGPHPFLQLSRMIVAGSGWAGSAPSESGTCHTYGAGLFPIFGRWLLRSPFPSGRTRGIIPARWAAAWRARPSSDGSRS